MQISSILVWGALALSGLIMALAAATEVTVTAISRAQVRRLMDEGVPRGQAVQTLLDDPLRYVITLLILKGVALVGAGGATTWLAISLGYQQWAILLALVLALAAMLSVQVAARALAVRSSEEAALRLAGPLRAAAAIMSPLVAALRGLGHLLLGPRRDLSTDNLFLSEDGLRFLINVAEEPGLIEEDEKQMIASIFELSETVAREVMVPRIDVVAVAEETSLNDALDIIITAGHSRIPVYRENVDNIQGVLYAKDLLSYFREGRHDVPISDLMRMAYYVPESKKVDELLEELQQRKVHMAIVVDEYGGTAGLVTIEDLLEEIVGEIQDEYDAEEPMITALGEDEFVFDARISLDEASRALGVELPAEESDTLGGFIFSELGRVPIVGSQVSFDNLVFEVQSLSGRRIQQVRVLRSAPAAEEGVAEVSTKKSLSALSSLF